jgi:uncharacterized membrane protein (DUF373 family)
VSSEPTGEQERDLGAVQSARRRREAGRRPLAVIERLDYLVHYLVAALLLVIAVIVLYRTADHLIVSRHDFVTQVTNGINDVLLVVIVMELLRTVVGHIESSEFQLRPFLIIGIISTVRRIVTVGIQLSLVGGETGAAFRRSQIELGVEAAVVLSLVVGLVLVSRAGVMPRD